MDTYLYFCHYCGNQYKPNRRNKQRFCSSSCRVNSFNQKKKMGLSKPQMETKPESPKEPTKIDKMSWAGVGNATVGAAAGTVAINLMTSLLTNEENKPATKKDLKDIMGQSKRFHIVKNVPAQIGFRAFYDMQTQTVVFQKVSRSRH